MPVLKGKDGKRYAPNYAPWNSQSNYMSITGKRENPEPAIKPRDFPLSMENQPSGNSLSPPTALW
jgi:hypothetical protein